MKQPSVNPDGVSLGQSGFISVFPGSQTREALEQRLCFLTEIGRSTFEPLLCERVFSLCVCAATLMKSGCNKVKLFLQESAVNNLTVPTTITAGLRYYTEPTSELTGIIDDTSASGFLNMQNVNQRVASSESFPVFLSRPCSRLLGPSVSTRREPCREGR